MALPLPTGMKMEEAVRDVRCFLRDSPGLNRIFEAQEGFESTDEQIILAIKMALDDWATTPPIPAIPIPYKLFIISSAIETLDSVILYYTRNQMNYNDGGIVVSVDDKFPGMTQAVERLKRDYEVKKRAYKTTANAEACYGGIESEYSIIPQNNY